MASSPAATSSGVPKVATVLYVRRTTSSTRSWSGRANVEPSCTGPAEGRSGVTGHLGQVPRMAIARLATSRPTFPIAAARSAGRARRVPELTSRPTA